MDLNMVIMLLIINDSLGAHMLSEISNLICLRHLFSSTAVETLNLFFFQQHLENNFCTFLNYSIQIHNFFDYDPNCCPCKVGTKICILKYGSEKLLLYVQEVVTHLIQ